MVANQGKGDIIMKLKGLKINFLGDSITAGYGTSEQDKVFHALLKKKAKLKEARNYGYSGSRFAIQKGTFSPLNDTVDREPFCKRFEEMDPDADVIVVFGGTNDYGHGDAPIGCFDDRTPDTFYGACHYIMSGLVKKYLGKPIIIMTPLHRTNERNKKGTDGARKPYDVASLKEYVEIIREVAEFYSLPVLDLYKNSGLQPEIPEIKERYIPDGLHPNDAGHEILADLVEKFLLAL